MDLFKIENLSFSYLHGSKSSLSPIVTNQVLSNINLKIFSGETTCISGPSGSGKSTLLNLLGLIEDPQTGRILYCEKDLGKMSQKEKDKLRLFDLGFIFQDFQLFDVLNVFENVEYFVSRQGRPSSERKRIVLEALGHVGMADYSMRLPRELSGGQKQRVAIARALAKKPRVIIADEPTANLDSKNARAILEILSKLSTKNGVSVIMASHDPNALEFSQRIFNICDGQIASDPSHRGYHDVG